METSVFIYIFMGFLGRGMIGTLINQKIGFDIILFCKPVNYLGAASITFALLYGSATAVQFGFFVSDLIIVSVLFINKRKNTEDKTTKIQP